MIIEKPDMKNVLPRVGKILKKKILMGREMAIDEKVVVEKIDNKILNKRGSYDLNFLLVV